MLSMFPISSLFTVISVIYASLTALLYLIFSNETDTLVDTLLFSAKGATALNILLVVFFSFGWKILWREFPSLNRHIFPDLNGTWDMKVNWEWSGKTGEARAQAVIKQNFLTISMEVESDQSESESLLAKAKKDPESGRPILYYIYRNTPKDTKQSSYLGTAILKLNLLHQDTLEGNYYTDSSSSGRYYLRKA